MVHMRADRIKPASGGLLLAAIIATTILAGCEDLPFVQAVHKDCANAPDVTACENADYARRYKIERERLKPHYNG